MNVPHRALIALANGKRFVLMRNVGQALEPRLQRIGELNLELTNFGAGVRPHVRAGEHNSSSDLAELAHGTAVAYWLNDKALKGDLGEVVVAADAKTLGQIRRHGHKALQCLIVGELAEDLINSPVLEIEQALAAA